MIDSGATGNYMSPDFKIYLGLLGIEKAQPEPISGLNGENLGSHLSEELGVGTCPYGCIRSLRTDQF